MRKGLRWDRNSYIWERISLSEEPQFHNLDFSGEITYTITE